MVTGQSILDKINKQLEDLIASQETTDAKTLTDRLILSYSVQTLENLRVLLSASGIEAVDVNTLKKFLADNWNNTKGTGLSYTAIPNSGVTGILCDAAELVAARLNTDEYPVGSFQILMPDVSFESPGFGGYGPLAPYKSEVPRGSLAQGGPIVQEELIVPQDFDFRRIIPPIFTKIAS